LQRRVFRELPIEAGKRPPGQVRAAAAAADVKPSAVEADSTVRPYLMSLLRFMFSPFGFLPFRFFAREQ